MQDMTTVDLSGVDEYYVSWNYLLTVVRIPRSLFLLQIISPVWHCDRSPLSAVVLQSHFQRSWYS